MVYCSRFPVHTKVGNLDVVELDGITPLSVFAHSESRHSPIVNVCAYFRVLRTS